MPYESPVDLGNFITALRQADLVDLKWGDRGMLCGNPLPAEPTSGPARGCAPPFLARRQNHIATGLYFSGDYEGTVSAARRAIRSHPDYPLTYRWLATALGQLGRKGEAAEALKKAVAIAPASFDMYVRRHLPYWRPEDHAHMVEGLRKAGWEG
jgi:tetratricopeptide (TPR) repeat protein